MVPIFFDCIREYVEPGHVAWLQEHLLPIPLEGCVISDMPPSRFVVDAASDNRSHTYIQQTFDMDNKLIEGVETAFNGQGEVVTHIKNDETVGTSIVFIKDLNKDAIRTAIISDLQLSTVISLFNIRNTILSAEQAIAGLVIQALVATVSNSFSVLKNDELVCDILHRVYGGIWTLLSKTDMQMGQVIPSKHMQNIDPDLYADAAPAMFLPTINRLVQIKDSKFVMDLFSGLGLNKGGTGAN